LIAFHSDRSGNNDIYVIHPLTGEQTQLTFENADDRVAAWSPDGKELAFQSNRDGDYEIYVITLDTLRTRQITANNCDDYNPVWSPDGRQFAFYSTCDGNREIYVIDMDGGKRRQLTETTNVYNWFPVWSPDGSLIAFASNRGGSYQVYTMRPDGSNLQAVAKGCVVSFSPNGRQIAYSQYCTDGGAIYTASAGGANSRMLDDQYENSNPSWSPDGRFIVFESTRASNSDKSDIWYMEADGQNWVQVTSDESDEGAPVWQP
jgi:TolB protein